MVRKAKQAGIEGVDLQGKTVVLSPEHYKGDEAARTFKCEGGFGCGPNTTGSAIFGTFISDGERARVERSQISHLALTQEVTKDSYGEAEGERVILVAEMAKQPATRPFRVVMVEYTDRSGPKRFSVHTEYRTVDEKRWARQDGAYGLTMSQAQRTWLQRVTEKSAWYGEACDRVEAPVDAYSVVRLAP